MKRNLYFLVSLLLIVFLSQILYGKDCSEVVEHADNAYTYARKASRSDGLEEAKRYVKKAMNEADEAKSEADECECDEAASHAEDAYDYLRRAYRSDDLDDVQRYAKRAMYEADDAKSAAENCE
ncbi:MAG: hypothetical protein V1779_00155 [bacterium]